MVDGFGVSSEERIFSFYVFFCNDMGMVQRIAARRRCHILFHSCISSFRYPGSLEDLQY